MSLLWSKTMLHPHAHQPGQSSECPLKNSILMVWACHIHVSHWGWCVQGDKKRSLSATHSNLNLGQEKKNVIWPEHVLCSLCSRHHVADLESLAFFSYQSYLWNMQRFDHCRSSTLITGSLFSCQIRWTDILMVHLQSLIQSNAYFVTYR